MALSLEWYERNAGSLALQAAPIRGRVDRAGLDREDYKSMLLAKAWEVSHHLPDNDATRAYTYRAMRNHLFNSSRHRKYMGCYASDLNPDIFSRGAPDGGLQRLVARDILFKVHSMMSQKDWDLLVAAMENGTSSKGICRLYRGVPLRTLTKRVHYARRRAKEVLKNLGVDGPDSNAQVLYQVRGEFPEIEKETVMSDTPNCYGLYWEAIEGAECLNCTVEKECLARFASGTLLKTQNELGKDAAPEKLAESLSVRVQAIRLAIAYQVNQGMRAPEPSPAPPPPEVQEKPQEVPTPPPVATTPQAVSVPKTEKPPEAGAEEESVSKKTKGKKATKPKAAKPTKVKTSKAKAKTLNPPKAGAAKRASVPAGSKRAVFARAAKAQGSSKTRKEWGVEYNQDRWLRERKRSKLIGMLQSGQVLPRVWGGTKQEVTVGEGFYLFKGKQYPTLYRVVKEITGTVEVPKQLRKDGSRPKGTRKLVAWSAPRFFNLAKLLGVASSSKKRNGKKRGKK